MIAGIVRNYLNRKTNLLLEEILTVVTDLTNSISDLNDRTNNLEKIIVKSTKPKYVIKNGKIEMG